MDFIGPIILSGCFAFLLGFFIGYAKGEINTHKTWKEDAIELGFAQYNIKSGQWEWKEK